MAPPTVPVGVPPAIRAGDTVVFDIAAIADLSLGTFDSTGYTLAPVFTASEAQVTAAAVPQGTGWRCTLTAEQTIGLKADGNDPEPVQWVLSATAGGERYTLATGGLTLLPDPTSQSDGAQSNAATCLATVRALITARLTDDLAEFSVVGRQARKEELRYLRTLEKSYAAQVQAETTGGFGTPIAWRLRPAC